MQKAQDSVKKLTETILAIKADRDQLQTLVEDYKLKSEKMTFDITATETLAYKMKVTVSEFKKQLDAGKQKQHLLK